MTRARKEHLTRNLVMMSVDLDDNDPQGNESVWLGNQVRNHFPDR